MIEITDSIWILFFITLFLSFMSDNIIYGVFVILETDDFGGGQSQEIMI